MAWSGMSGRGEFAADLLEAVAVCSVCATQGAAGFSKGQLHRAVEVHLGVTRSGKPLLCQACTQAAGVRLRAQQAARRPSSVCSVCGSVVQNQMLSSSQLMATTKDRKCPSCAALAWQQRAAQRDSLPARCWARPRSRALRSAVSECLLGARTLGSWACRLCR